MKRLRTLFVVCLSLLLLPGLSAQSGRTHIFKKDKFIGNIRLQIGLENGENVANSNYDPTEIESEIGKTISIKITSIENVRKDTAGGKDFTNKFLNNNEIFFPFNCNNSSNENVLQRIDGLSQNLYRRENQGFKMAEMRFKITGYGRARITIGYTAVRRGGTTSDCEQETGYTIVIKAPALSPDEQWRELEQQGILGICNYLSKEPNGLLADRATRTIKAQLDNEWNLAKNQMAATENKKERLSICERFLKKYEACQASNSSALANAQILKTSLTNEIAKPSTPKVVNPIPKPTKENPEEILWNQTQDSHKIEKYQAFLSKFPNGKFKQFANDSILRLTPISVSAAIEKKDGSITIAFSHLSHPSFEANGLAVEDYFSDNTLTVTFMKPNGKFDLVVSDLNYPWKTVTQHVDNLFVPQMTIAEDHFTVNFEGGVKPYTLEIIDTTVLINVWSKKGIQESSYTVNFKELLAKGLSGKFKVRVSDGSVPASTINLQYITLHRSNWWIIILAVLIVIGIGVTAYFAYKFSTKKSTNIFNT